jgi:hypothetical protein
MLQCATVRYSESAASKLGQLNTALVSRLAGVGRQKWRILVHTSKTVLFKITVRLLYELMDITGTSTID